MSTWICFICGQIIVKIWESYTQVGEGGLDSRDIPYKQLLNWGGIQNLICRHHSWITLSGIEDCASPWNILEF